MWQHGVWTCRVWTGSFSTIRRWRPRSTCIGWGVRPASASAARPWSSYRRPKSNSSVDWAPEASSQLLSFTFYLLLRAHQYFPVSSLFILNFTQFNLNYQFWFIASLLINLCVLSNISVMFLLYIILYYIRVSQIKALIKSNLLTTTCSSIFPCI